MYILNINLKKSSKMLYGLIKLYGLGPYLTTIMLNELNIGSNSRIKDLSQAKVIKIIKWIEKNRIIVENALKQKIASDIDQLKHIKTHRGLQHIYELPVRGQRTKTNALPTRKKNNKC